MSTVWPQLEPLLARVQKPARYIGCEDGAQTPDHDPGAGGLAARSTPTPTRSGCPTRACRSSTRSSTSAPTPSPSGPTPRGPTSRRELRASTACRCSRVDTHRPAGDFDVLAFNLSAELVYTNLLNCVDLAGVPVRAAERRPDAPAGRRRRALHLQPRAAGRLRRRRRARRRRGGRRRDHRGRRRVEGARHARGPASDVLRELAPASPGVYVPSLYDVAYDGAGLVGRRRPATPTCPATVEKRTIADLAEWPYPKNQLVPLTEVVHDRLNVEVFRGCTRGCRFCQAGHDHPPGARAPGRPGPHHGAPRACGAPATTRSPSPRCPPPTSRGIEQVVADTVDDPDGCGQVSVVAAVAAGRRLHRRHRRRDPEGPPHRPHLRPRGRHLAHAPGHQQAHQRGGPLRARSTPAYSQGWRRMKLYFLTGLPTETDEDTLGIAELARNCVEIGKAHHKGAVGDGLGRRLRAQAVHAVPVVRPEHRRGAAAQDRPAARRRPQGHGRAAQVARPQGHRRSRASSAAAIAASGRSSRTCGAHGGTFQEWSEHFDLDLWLDGLAAAGLDRRLVRAPPPHRGRGAAVGPPLGRAAQGLPLAGLARRPRPRSACRTAAGRPATTAAPAPATASSTSSPRPSRPPAAARAPARTSPSAARCRCRCSRRRRRRPARVTGPRP